MSNIIVRSPKRSFFIETKNIHLDNMLGLHKNVAGCMNGLFEALSYTFDAKMLIVCVKHLPLNFQFWALISVFFSNLAYYLTLTLFGGSLNFVQRLIQCITEKAQITQIVLIDRFY